MSKTYTITAALPYTNGPIHIGHLSGVYIPADIYARFLRITGNEVVYICGSDEHGVPITIKAKKEGVSKVDLDDISGSGSNGRVTKKDILNTSLVVAKPHMKNIP